MVNQNIIYECCFVNILFYILSKLLSYFININGTYSKMLYIESNYRYIKQSITT